jgi:hypothetical protein
MPEEERGRISVTSFFLRQMAKEPQENRENLKLRQQLNAVSRKNGTR